MLLRFEGHEVETAHSAHAALDGAERMQPDVVLLDIGLPEMDGYQVARRLRATLQRRDLRLVALTGHGQTEDRARSREAGFDDHLVKPADFERLNRILATHGDDLATCH
jgi:CheY-like chemotaxis protein